MRHITLWEVRAYNDKPGEDGFSRPLGRGRCRRLKRAEKLARYLRKRYGMICVLAPYRFWKGGAWNI